MKEIKIDIKALQVNSKKQPTERFRGLKELMSKEIIPGTQVLNDKIKEKFYSEFGTLLSAGVDFRTALEIIENDQRPKVKKIFGDLRKHVINGKTLSSAMSISKHFSSFEYNSISIGEESGRLMEQLKELSVYFNRKVKQKRQIISALTYPSIVLSVAIGAIIFMLKYLVPMFEDIFKRFGGDLPVITKAIIAASGWVETYIYLIFLVLIVVSLLLYSQRKKTYFKRISSAFILKVPFIGKLVLKINLAQFTNSIQLLLNSSIPLVKALELTEKMLLFYPIQSNMDEIKKDVVNGTPLHQAMKKHSVYPAKMISIIKVAEDTNTLGYSFQKLTTQYQEEVEHQTSIINTALEPVIIIVLGLVISIILIGMYLPLFQVNSLMDV